MPKLIFPIVSFKLGVFHYVSLRCFLNIDKAIRPKNGAAAATVEFHHNDSLLPDRDTAKYMSTWSLVQSHPLKSLKSSKNWTKLREKCCFTLTPARVLHVKVAAQIEAQGSLFLSRTHKPQKGRQATRKNRNLLTDLTTTGNTIFKPFAHQKCIASLGF